MSRITEWRKVCPKEIRQNQIHAMEANTLFLVRQKGPLAFLVQDINKPKPYEIRLGDPHKCTCKNYGITTDLCLHICWIILKKLRVGSFDSVSFQKGMTAQELRRCLSARRESRCYDKKKITLPPIIVDDDDDDDDIKFRNLYVKPVRKRIGKMGDACPICLDSYTSDDIAVAYCKYSCGNGVHARCISMLLKHSDTEQNETTSSSISHRMLKCPLCRGDFNEIAELRTELQKLLTKRKRKIRKSSPSPPLHNVSCRFCRTEPVRGYLYRCLECESILLCASCLKSISFRIYHGTHVYAVKKKTDGPWRRMGKIEEHFKASNNSRNTPFALPSLSPLPSSSLQDKTTQNFSPQFPKGRSFGNCGQNNFTEFVACAICPSNVDSTNFKRNRVKSFRSHFNANFVEKQLNAFPTRLEDGVNESDDDKRIIVSKYKTRIGRTMEPLEVRISRIHLTERLKSDNNAGGQYSRRIRNVFSKLPPVKICESS